MPLRTLSRRSLIRTLYAAAALGLAARPLQAEELPHLDPNDPKARTLGYLDNVGQIDASKNAAYVPGSTCDNCLLLQGPSGLPYRPCNLFPGKLVSARGWCSGWSAEI